MKRILKGTFALISLVSILLIGGCESMSSYSSLEEKNAETKTSGMTPVQDYVGQGFSMVEGERTEDEVATHPMEIEAAAKAYMKEKYQFDVIVNNIVPARDGALCFVESTEQPYFHTSVMVGVDTVAKEGRIGSEHVSSTGGKVEGAIVTGLYQMAYEEEFRVLDSFIVETLQKYPVVGLTEEALDKTCSSGYATPYYYVTGSTRGFPEIYEAYMNNRQMSKEEIRAMFEANNFNPEDEVLGINFNLFMAEENAKSDKEIADSIIEDLRQIQGVPKGSYAVFLNGNLILDRKGLGEGESEGTTFLKNNIYKY